MTIYKAIISAISKLSSSSPRLDAELLLSFVIKKNRTYIFTHPNDKLTLLQTLKYKRLITKRTKLIPIAYLINQKNFYNLSFFVNKNVLIPRPETELFIDEIKKNKNKNKIIFDLGTGSGCIIITLANYNIAKKYFAIDISKAALKVAKFNAKYHKQDKINFVQGNLLEPIIKKIENNEFKINNTEVIITANLPYLNQNYQKSLQTPNQIGLKYEPSIALNGGIDGLKYYRILNNQLTKFTKLSKNNKISVYCEINPEQSSKIQQIFTTAQRIEIKKDLANQNRLAIIYL